ncbi:MAG: hypothetical protein JWM44_2097 [Bacilli bacterium]|nr:hypothetical protein [Bacilli bacterium]
MKNILKSTLIITLMFSLIRFGHAAADNVSFSDISGHWAENSILQAVQKGYVEGYPDGTFKPDGKVTRAELIKMVVTAMKLVPGPTGDHWYDTYVNAAVSNQIYKYDFTGNLNNPMTRQELSIIGVRATREDIRNAKDFDIKRFMYEATKSGIVQGLGNGELGIDQTTTRAQAVTIIERILTLNAGGKLSVDKHAVSRAEVAWHKTNVFTMLPRYFPEIDPIKHDSNLDKWDYKKAFYDSSDGIYHEELERYVIVDMNDKNDPFRSDVEGFTFPVGYKDETTNKFVDKSILAPEKSYVEVNVIKQIYKKQVVIADKSRYKQITQSGHLYFNSGDGLDGLASGWSGMSVNEAYKQLDLNGTVNNGSLYGQLDPKLNKTRNGLPLFYSEMPANGGTYLVYQAKLVPYGDLSPLTKFNQHNILPNIIDIDFSNNSSIAINSNDHKKDTDGTTEIYTGHTDYTLSNN